MNQRRPIPAPVTAPELAAFDKTGQNPVSLPQSRTDVPGRNSILPDNVDRNFDRRYRSSVLEPVSGVSILGPAHSRSIVCRNAISMVSDRSLQYVDDPGSVFMVVSRAEDRSRLERHHTHSKVAACHPFDLRAKIDRCQ